MQVKSQKPFAKSKGSCTAGRMIGAPLPSLHGIYTTCLTCKAFTIVRDASHHTHNLFHNLCGQRYRSLSSTFPDSLTTCSPGCETAKLSPLPTPSQQSHQPGRVLGILPLKKSLKSGPQSSSALCNLHIHAALIVIIITGTVTAAVSVIIAIDHLCFKNPHQHL